MAGYEVKVLKQGYARPARNGCQHADGSITLVRGACVVLVDTGGPWDRTMLIAALEEEGLNPAAIDHVVCTHGHSDHVGNIGLFAQATLIVSHDISIGDLYTPHPFQSGEPYRIDDHITVLPTPGHTAEDVSVLVRAVDGCYAICGDLFECEQDLLHEELWRSCSADPERQALSREHILRVADFVVPGHGAPFAVASALAAPDAPPGRAGGRQRRL